MEQFLDKSTIIEKHALQQLEEAGYQAYVVGGRVRDQLMEQVYGKQDRSEDPLLDLSKIAGSLPGMSKTEDVDVTTNAKPDEIKKVFREYTTIDTGIRHGTVTVLLPCDPHWEDKACDPGREGGQRLPVEITTYRRDGSYSDGRHPDQVAFVTSLEEDLARRDFTINAVARDRRGKLMDPFGGAEDVKKGVIRAVGDPVQRFQEDALRIMRALRFSAVLGFAIEAETAAAICSQKHLLKNIAVERIWQELKKLVIGRNAGQVIRRYPEVLGEVIPELLPMKGFQQHNPYHKYDVLEHCIRAMEAVETTPQNQVYLKLAALFHDMGKPSTYSQDQQGIGHFYRHPQRSSQLVREILKRFKAESFMIERVTVLVKNHDLLFEKDTRLLKRWMNRLTPEILFELLAIKWADNQATGNMSEELSQKFGEIREMMEEIVAEGECFSLKDLAAGGKDLLQLGMKEGPEIGQVLNHLLGEVIEGRLVNEKAALLERAAELAKENALSR